MTVCASRARWRGPRVRRAVIGGALAAGTVFAGGCSGTLEDVAPEREPAYKSSRGASPLEVPPDLTSASMGDSLEVPGIEATYSQYAGDDGTRAAGAVLPEVDGVRLGRSGDERWLVAASEPEAVWPEIRDFWTGQGFTIETEEPAIGLMETNWAEKRDPLPAGLIKRMMSELSDAFYGVAIRDRYRTRIERGSEPGTTEIHVSHRGAELVLSGDENSYARREGFADRVWQPRPSNPGLEAEMLARLMLFLGADERQAEALLAADPAREPRAHIVRDEGGAVFLTLAEDFSRAWRRTGQALDRAGFTVEDRDRSRGLFFVRYADPEAGAEGEETGWLSRLKFWGGDDDAQEAALYLVRLSGEAQSTTRVVVLDRDGEPEESPAAARILSLLHEGLE